MKRDIIHITNPIYAIPKEKTWYQYYDVIFISVIPSCNIKPYIRRKSESSAASKKNDNPMCAWHSDWQYNKIEGTYGSESTRTFEITISYENEIHRIDSLVKDVAIEFQHTLSVSINEMDSRFMAHKGAGLIPMLVLDFTSFKYDDFKFFDFKKIEQNQYMGYSKPIWTEFILKIKKWQNSKYFINGNLFLDFSDTMIQVVPKLNKKIIVFERTIFIENIGSIENYTAQKIIEEKERILEEKKEANRIEQIQKEEELEDRERRQKIKINQNKIDIEQSFDYKYYRLVLQEMSIKSKIEKVISNRGSVEFVEYSVANSIDRRILKKHHTYKLFHNTISNDHILSIEYITNGKLKDANKYEYLFAEIILRRKLDRGLRTFVFIKKKEKPAIRSVVRYEIIEDFLHSTKEPSLTVYDEDGRMISSDYYLFNVKIESKEEWRILSDHYDLFGYIDESERKRYEKTFEKIQLSDKWNFIQYFCQNDYIPDSVRDEYYAYMKEKYGRIYNK
jgi:hypothetical protein